MQALAPYIQWFTDKNAMHTILLGAIGSAVFWIVLQLIKFVISRMSKVGSEAWLVAGKRNKFREYIYRRFTSREGLIPASIGFQHSVSQALSYMLTGLMFCCVALLIGGYSKIVLSICLVSALVYFGNAWLWVTPDKKWRGDNDLDHWQRVAEL